MPELHSFGLGGGSHVSLKPCVKVGPLSVGRRLAHEAKCVGGQTLTATDVVVKLGLLEGFGDPHKVDLSQADARAAVETILSMVEEGVDKIKVHSIKSIK